MKKHSVIILFTLFILASFIGMNLYVNTNAFPGYGGNGSCNECHNQPALVQTVDVSFQLGDWDESYNAFANNFNYSRNYVPVIQTNNRSDPIQFIPITFLKNSTHVMIMTEIPDRTPSGASTATSDKFGIIFNIDVSNFTVGSFFTSYNSSPASPTDQILTGQMAFSNGHADLWYVDMARIQSNSIGMAQDEAISTGIISDGATHQDIHVAIYYGSLSPYSFGYRIYMVRPLDTKDGNDVQFDQDGEPIYYAIAQWDNSAKEYHSSSFDQMIIVGDNLNLAQTATQYQTVTNTETKTETVNPTQTVTDTKTETVTNTETKTEQLTSEHTTTETIVTTVSGIVSNSISNTASSFTVTFVMFGLIMSIPIYSRYRRRKD